MTTLDKGKKGHEKAMKSHFREIAEAVIVALVLALLAFCGVQLLGTGVAASGLHVQSESIGWALVYLGMFVGNAGSLLSAWYWYVRREKRGDWCATAETAPEHDA